MARQSQGEVMYYDDVYCAVFELMVILQDVTVRVAHTELITNDIFIIYSKTHTNVKKEIVQKTTPISFYICLRS